MLVTLRVNCLDKKVIIRLISCYYGYLYNKEHGVLFCHSTGFACLTPFRIFNHLVDL